MIYGWAGKRLKVYLTEGKVVKEETLIIFSDTADALNAALGPILDGTYTPVADYLGAPSV